jgi:Rap1a immunity proteins
MRRLLLSMALLSCGIGSGWCETITVEQLGGDCASRNGSGGQTACAAYLMGMVHGLQMGTLFTKRRKPFCIPDGMKSPQAIQMFNNAVTESPEMQKEAADLLWIMTLSSAFPCPKSK